MAKYKFLMISPGCGGFFIGMGRSPLMEYDNKDGCHGKGVAAIGFDE